MCFTNWSTIFLNQPFDQSFTTNSAIFPPRWARNRSGLRRPRGFSASPPSFGAVALAGSSPNESSPVANCLLNPTTAPEIFQNHQNSFPGFLFLYKNAQLAVLHFQVPARSRESPLALPRSPSQAPLTVQRLEKSIHFMVITIHKKCQCLNKNM